MHKLKMLQQTAAYGVVPAHLAQQSCGAHPDVTTFYASSLPEPCAEGFETAIANLSLTQGVQGLLTYAASGALASADPTKLHVDGLSASECGQACLDDNLCVGYGEVLGHCVRVFDAVLASAAVTALDADAWASQNAGEVRALTCHTLSTAFLILTVTVTVTYPRGAPSPT